MPEINYGGRCEAHLSAKPCAECAKLKQATERRSNRKPAVTQKQILDAMHEWGVALQDFDGRGPEVDAKHAAVVALLWRC